MTARNDVKILSDLNLGSAKLVLAAAQLRLAAQLDLLVARWLERYATKAEAAAQRVFRFKADRQART
jgi:ATP phosphoribosyltransferase